MLNKIVSKNGVTLKTRVIGAVR